MVDTFYASEAVYDIGSYAESVATAAPRTAMICRWMAEKLNEAPKFRLPDGGELLGDPTDTYYSAFADIAKPPFPIQSIEFQTPGGRAGFSEGGRHHSPRRLGLVFDLSLSPLRDEILGLFEGYAAILSDRPFAEGVLVAPIVCRGPLVDTQDPHGTKHGWYPGHSAVVIHCGQGIEQAKFRPPFGGARVAARVLLGEIGAATAAGLPPSPGRGAGDLAFAECGPEILAAISLGAAVSCRNVQIRPAPAPEKLNKKRRSRGAPPLHDYLSIETHAAVDILRGGWGDGAAADHRANLRRGHMRRHPERRDWINATAAH